MTNVDYDYGLLDKQLEIVKTKTFLGKNAAFFGSILCSLNFSWVFDQKTAATNGISIMWNPKHFLRLPLETRVTVLMHELWHVAKFDMLRRGDRNPEIWNFACDLEININLKKDGYSFAGTRPWLDMRYDGMIAEQIYDHLMLMAKEELEAMMAQGPWGPPSGNVYEEDEDDYDTGDLFEPNDEMDNHIIINNVVQAVSAAKMSGNAGDVPGDIENSLRRFLQPKLPWNQLLYNFFNELSERDYSKAKPNRRYQDIYMSSLLEDHGLECILYFIDVSGSVSDNEVIRCNSEIKYIKDVFNPLKLIIVLFDTIIQKEIVFNQEDPFDEIIIVGRGGTSLVPVRDYIIEHNPTAVIIFSDLQCSKMEKLPFDVPIIWVAVNNSGATVDMGQLVHIRE